MILVLLGPPGSGKGTQAKKLINERKWPQLSTGDMLRTAIAKQTKLGMEAKSYIDRGALVPDNLVVGLIAERIQAPDCKGGFILDGFPRTIAQAESLDRMLKEQGRTVDRAVLFDASDAELVRRLSGRRTCFKCGAMYHIDGMMPKKDGVCDACGATSIGQRDDDKIEVITKRLKVYHDQTSPLIQYYKNQGKLSTLDAMRSPAEVADALAQILK